MGDGGGGAGLQHERMGGAVGAQPPAELSRVDVVASVSFRQVSATAGALTHWTGPGFSLTVNGNVNGNVAIASSVEKFSEGRAAVLAGLQLSTSFYYGSGRDATPGRFFAKFLVGASGVGVDADPRSRPVRRRRRHPAERDETGGLPVGSRVRPHSRRPAPPHVTGAPPSASCSALESEDGWTTTTTTTGTITPATIITATTITAPTATRTA